MRQPSFPAIAAVLALGLAAAPAFAQSAHGHGREAPSSPSEQPAKDTWITTKVKAALMAADGVPGVEIKVDTQNGTVWLVGDVKTTAERDRAIAKARAVKGVVAVEAGKLTVAGR